MNPTIKETRRELGITQKQMGRLMGMPQSSLARIESGIRHETKEHIVHLQALLVIHRHGLLAELVSQMFI